MTNYKKIDYVIENLSPINFSEKSVDSIFYATKKYIPGSVVRGALAASYINENNLKDAHKDDKFFELFLSGKVKFLPAYPIGVIDAKNAEPFVLPLSMMQSKDGKIICDYAAHVKDVPGLKKLQGMAVREGEKLYKIDTEVQIELHMGRTADAERLQGKSVGGNIYNYEYITPFQKFKGSFVVAEEMEKELLQVLNKFNGQVVYLGRAKSAQYGKCSFNLLNTNNCCFNEDVNLNNCYLYVATPFVPVFAWQNIKEAAEQIIATLNARLSGVSFALRADENDEVKYFAAKEELNGYVNVWHAKREKVDAISVGSLIPVQILGNFDNEAVNKALLEGVGDRVAEGYGQLRLWNPLEKIQFSECLPVMNKPVLNEEVKRRARIIIETKLLLEVQTLAMKAVETIERKEKSKVSYTVNDKSVKEKAPNHVLKRIETLMDSSLTKEEIQKSILKYKDTAKKNLKKVKLGNSSLYEVLVTGEQEQQPYHNVMWNEVLGIDDETMAKLNTDFGSKVFYIDESKIYRTYWLWFVRHLTKLKGDNVRKEDTK